MLNMLKCNVKCIYHMSIVPVVESSVNVFSCRSVISS